MLIVFFDIFETVHHEFVSQGQTVETEDYFDVLGQSKENSGHRRPELWHNDLTPYFFLFPELKFSLLTVAVDQTSRSIVISQIKM